MINGTSYSNYAEQSIHMLGDSIRFNFSQYFPIIQAIRLMINTGIEQGSVDERAEQYLQSLVEGEINRGYDYAMTVLGQEIQATEKKLIELQEKKDELSETKTSAIHFLYTGRFIQ
jgi:hypothetical protein